MVMVFLMVTIGRRGARDARNNERSLCHNPGGSMRSKHFGQNGAFLSTTAPQAGQFITSWCRREAYPDLADGSRFVRLTGHYRTRFKSGTRRNSRLLARYLADLRKPFVREAEQPVQAAALHVNDAFPARNFREQRFCRCLRHPREEFVDQRLRVT